MSDPKNQVGKILWQDLTVDDAESIKNFYAKVVGWQSDPHNMGDYHDFNINAPGDGTTVAGICHARGSNANIPPLWLIYVGVEDVKASANACLEMGGKVLDGPRSMGNNEFCVIQDPAGAVMGLISVE